MYAHFRTQITFTMYNLIVPPYYTYHSIPKWCLVPFLLYAFTFYTAESHNTHTQTHTHTQLQDDIDKLRAELRQKEVDMADVKRALGITPYVELKQSLSHGWDVMGNKLRGIQDTQGLVEELRHQLKFQCFFRFLVC